MGDEGRREIRKIHRSERDFARQIGSNLMPNILDWRQSQGRAVAAAPLGMARALDQVREATRQLALDEVAFALSAVAQQPPALPDVIRDRADRVLARATLMQIEIDRFLAASRGVRVETRRTTCHGGPRRQTIYK